MQKISGPAASKRQVIPLAASIRCDGDGDLQAQNQSSPSVCVGHLVVQVLLLTFHVQLVHSMNSIGLSTCDQGVP